MTLFVTIAALKRKKINMNTCVIHERNETFVTKGYVLRIVALESVKRIHMSKTKTFLDF